MALGAAGQDERLARGKSLLQQQRGVDLMDGAGKGEHGPRGPVFLQREDAAADGLRAFGLVGGVERALGLADIGAQSFLFFDDGHGVSLRSDKISSPLW